MFLWLAGLVVFLYVWLVAWAFFFQRMFVYHPTRQVWAVPETEYEDVEFIAADGVKLTGWFVPADQARATVLFCHGNGGNVAHRVNTISVLRELGLNVFIFDYRGYGKSEGKPTEEGTYLDAEAAWGYLTGHRGIDPARIVLVGRSLGSAVASHLLRTHTPGVLSIEAGFTSFEDAAQDMMPFLPIKYIARYSYTTAENLAQAKCPVLVSHSRDDKVIGPHHGLKLYEVAPEPKAFVELSGSHLAAFEAPAGPYARELSRFVGEHIR